MATKGVYQGADTMGAVRDQSLWDVLQGQKRHKKKQDEMLGYKAIASSVGDILKTVSPGYGHVADVGIDWLSNEFLEIPEYEEEGGSFWGSKQIAEYGEQADAISKGADVSLLESIIGNVGDYVGVGTDTPKEFDLSSLFSSGGADMPQAYGEFSPEFMSQFMKNGGRVPKYENGGLLSKLKFGKKKKDKVPERDEALVALDAILSREYEKEVGEHEYPYGYNVAQDEAYSNGRTTARTIAKFMTPEGERFYPGEQTSLSNSLARSISMMDAASRAYHSPADSITTDQLEKFRELGLFAGGGMVESGSPTISGYFSQQGKTLGGSNTQSLAEKLGRT